MNKTILAILAATLLTPIAYAQNFGDHDARDTAKWLQSVSAGPTATSRDTFIKDSGGGSSGSAEENGQLSGPDMVQPQFDKGGRHH